MQLAILLICSSILIIEAVNFVRGLLLAQAFALMFEPLVEAGKKLNVMMPELDRLQNEVSQQLKKEKAAP